MVTTFCHLAVATVEGTLIINEVEHNKFCSLYLGCGLQRMKANNEKSQQIC